MVDLQAHVRISKWVKKTTVADTSTRPYCEANEKRLPSHLISFRSSLFHPHGWFSL